MNARAQDEGCCVLAPKAVLQPPGITAGSVGLIFKDAEHQQLLLDLMEDLHRAHKRCFQKHRWGSAGSAGSQYLFGEPAWRLSPLLTSITVTPLRYQLLLGTWDNIFFQAILDTLLPLPFYVVNHFRADLGHD